MRRACERAHAARTARALTRARTAQDHIVIASDSGRIVILAYNKEHNRFDKASAQTWRTHRKQQTRAHACARVAAQRCRSRSLRARRARLARPARAAPAPQRAWRP
jgi:hypothetical protein